MSQALVSAPECETQAASELLIVQDCHSTDISKKLEILRGSLKDGVISSGVLCKMKQLAQFLLDEKYDDA